MVGKKKRKVGVKKATFTSQVDEETPNSCQEKKVFDKHKILSTQTTPQRIRTLDDLETFTRLSRLGGTLERRFIDKESVDTPRPQLTPCAQISGTNLSPFLRNVELENASTQIEQNTSDSQARADIQNSPLKVSETPHPVRIPLSPTRSRAKDVPRDEKSKSPLVPPGYEHRNDFDSLLQDSTENLPDIGTYSLPLHISQGNDHSAESRHSQPSVRSNDTEEILSEDNVSSSTNINGSKEMTAKTNEPRPSQSFSLDTTQIIEAMGTYDFAVSTGASNALVYNVEGYKVKPQYVGLLTSIISKHGDIGANSSIVSGTIRSMCMEHVCDIVESLQKTDLKRISDEQLKTMIAMVDDLEKDRVDVRWLKTRLDEISEAKKAIPQLLQSSKLTQLHTNLVAKVVSVKQQLEKYKEQRDEQEKALFDLQKKIDSTEPLLAEAEAEVTETENLMAEIKTKLKRVYKLKSLAHSLV